MRKDNTNDSKFHFFLSIAAVVLVILYIDFTNFNEVPDNPNLIKKIKSFSTNQIDTLKLPNCSVKDYNRLTDYAIELSKDEISENSLKGEVLIAVLANHLTNKINDNSLKCNSNEMKSLEKKFANYQYFINQKPINNFLKIAHHSCEGNYKYIYSRLKVKSYFIPLIIFSSLFLIFSILVILQLIKWKFSKVYSITFFIISILLFIIYIIFNNTCSECVTDDSFYGISL